jgi:hypothetical protein
MYIVTSMLTREARRGMVYGQLKYQGNRMSFQT